MICGNCKQEISYDTKTASFHLDGNCQTPLGLRRIEDVRVDGRPVGDFFNIEVVCRLENIPSKVVDEIHDLINSMHSVILPRNQLRLYADPDFFRYLAVYMGCDDDRLNGMGSKEQFMGIEIVRRPGLKDWVLAIPGSPLAP